MVYFVSFKLELSFWRSGMRIYVDHPLDACSCILASEKNEVAS